MIEINNKTRAAINLTQLKTVIYQTLKLYRQENKDVSVALVGDKTIRRLNKKYRRQDKVTDVLSFADQGSFLGEIVIDYQQIRRQARASGNSSKQELIFILIHGMLHLLGLSDKTERQRKKMIKSGEKIIKKINLSKT